MQSRSDRIRQRAPLHSSAAGGYLEDAQDLMQRNRAESAASLLYEAAKSSINAIANLHGENPGPTDRKVEALGRIQARLTARWRRWAEPATPLPCPASAAGGMVVAMMTTQISNDDFVDLFNNMAAMLEIKGDSVFKIRAYQRAANTIDQLSWSLAGAVANGDDLRKVPGIGKAISEKVQEYVATGHVAAYDRLAEELPPNVLELLEVPGMGPKTVKAAVEELNIASVAELEQAALDGRLAQLPRNGQEVGGEHLAPHSRATDAL